jgi:hypothetical protein
LASLPVLIFQCLFIPCVRCKRPRLVIDVKTLDPHTGIDWPIEDRFEFGDCLAKTVCGCCPTYFISRALVPRARCEASILCFETCLGQIGESVQNIRSPPQSS